MVYSMFFEHIPTPNKYNAVTTMPHV